jgi:hypothetical protein
VSNGKVFTSDPVRRFVQAAAIAGDRISAVVTTSEIVALADAHTRRVDLAGSVVVPGINDAHFIIPPTHARPYSRLPVWNPAGKRCSILSPWRWEAPKGSWILGIHGIGVVNDPRATRLELDRIAPKHPVRLNPYFGHGSVLNTRAMAALELSEEEPDPLGCCCERVAEASGLPANCSATLNGGPGAKLACEASDAEAINSAQQLAQEAIRFGVTSMQNMSLMASARYVRMLEQAKLPIRIRVIRFPLTGLQARDLSEGRDLAQHPGKSDRITVSGGTKWLLDGTPLERRAALRTEYRDRPGWSGQLYLPESEMRAMLRESVENGDPLLVHAVGDKSAEAFLSAMELE